jgi:uncharacterized protein (DUF952 family)
MPIIHHITKRESWDEAKTIGFYSTPTFTDEGFIHCSTPEQIIATANRHYHGQTGLLLLSIETKRVTVPIVYENLVGGEQQFPHIYGQLNLDAVTEVKEFEPGAHGVFELV